MIGTLPHLGVNGTGIRGLVGHSLAQHPRGITDLCVACEQGEEMLLTRSFLAPLAVQQLS